MIPDLKSFKDPKKKGEFERFREYLRGVLGADKALFPTSQDSSLTLTTPNV